MAQWFVKDLSKLTGVSVQTLHHYDRVKLLKPSLRLTNGYRVYSEKDLLKLQQIIALKFFGFTLSEVKQLLDEESSIFAHFSSQVKVLEQQANTLQQAAQTLKNIVASVDSNPLISWETIIEMIEVYKMTAQLEHEWVKEIFTADELKQYTEFEKEIKALSTKEVFEEKWQGLLQELKQNMEIKPDSPLGIQTGKKYMDFINSIYGKKHANLRTRKWEQGFCEGKGLDEIGLSSEMILWLKSAVDAYWKERLINLLNQAGKIPDSALLTQWNETLDEMFGEETSRKDAIYEIALKEENLSLEAKIWLENIRNTQ